MLAVPLRFDAVVEDGHAAVVLFGADEAADGLDEFDAGFGDGDFDERVAAALFYPAVLGFFDGVVGPSSMAWWCFCRRTALGNSPCTSKSGR